MIYNRKSLPNVCFEIEKAGDSFDVTLKLADVHYTAQSSLLSNTIFNFKIYSFDFLQSDELQGNQLIKVQTTLIQQKNITVLENFEISNKGSSWIIEVITVTNVL